MRGLKWILLTASAVLYAATHVASYYLWWVAFFSWAPLLYVVATERISFKEGFVWGIIAMYGHCGGLFYSLALMAQGTFLVRALPGLFVCMYFALYAALWFWILHK
nr:hypothetical protein [Candidatus Dependentiae bacterium]